MTNNNRALFNTALAIFPSKDGFGWVVFDGPLSLVAWGISTLTKETGTPQQKNVRCMTRIEQFVSRYHPATIVLEAFEGPGTRRNPRIKQLCRSIVSLAAMDHTAVQIISRKQIASYFETTQPKTRYAIASAVASSLNMRHRLPEKRRPWETEKTGMALFNAAALLFVHYGNPGEPL